jgi:anti-sigma regulatory factor (Ser/Thr protein kinase)
MSALADSRAVDAFHHEAVLYRGLDQMVERVAPFIIEGLERGESVLVAELSDRVTALERALGTDAARVSFIDMSQVGRNPARIIPAWRRFVDQHRGEGGFRGVGEPAWAGRRDVELDECRLHEALLNVAFDDGPAWQLLCPYDTEGLSAEVIANAQRTHPVVTPLGSHVDYEGHAHARSEFARALPAAPEHAEQICFTEQDLAGLRSVVRRLCDQAQLEKDTAEDLVLAAHELACNSVVHGGGGGTLRSWGNDASFVMEVQDKGIIEDVMVGRGQQFQLNENGRGLWMANQLCDLVQVRSSEAGTMVRMHTWL